MLSRIRYEIWIRRIPPSHKAFEEVIRKGDEAPLKEAAKRSERARQALAEVRAHKRFGEAYPPVQLFTYKADSTATSEVYEDISEILGVRVRETGWVGARRDTLTLEIKNAYLLQTLDELGDWNWRGDGFDIWAGFPRSPYRAYARHVSFFFESFLERHEYEFAEGKTVSSILGIRMRHDRACRFVGYKGFRFLEVTDDLGKSLLSDKPQESEAATLKAPSPEAKKLVRVRGLFRVLLPEKEASEEISLTGDGKTVLPLWNMTLSLEDLVDQGRSVRLGVKVGDIKSDHVLPETSDFQLKGKDGKLLHAEGRRVGQRDAWVVNLKFDIPEGFEAEVLKIRYFKSVGVHEIPFEFKDVRIR